MFHRILFFCCCCRLNVQIQLLFLNLELEGRLKSHLLRLFSISSSYRLNFNAKMLQVILGYLMQIEMLTPKEYIGPLMELGQERRGVFREINYITENRASIIYELPLAEVILLYPHYLFIVIMKKLAYHIFPVHTQIQTELVGFPINVYIL